MHLPNRAVSVVRFGKMHYADALNLQQLFLRQKLEFNQSKDGIELNKNILKRDFLLLGEHPSVFTCGKRIPSKLHENLPFPIFHVHNWPKFCIFLIQFFQDWKRWLVDCSQLRAMRCISYFWLEKFRCNICNIKFHDFLLEFYKNLCRQTSASFTGSLQGCRSNWCVFWRQCGCLVSWIKF